MRTRLGDGAGAIAVAERGHTRYPEAWEFPLVIDYNAALLGDATGARGALAEAARLRPGVPELEDLERRAPRPWP